MNESRSHTAVVQVKGGLSQMVKRLVRTLSSMRFEKPLRLKRPRLLFCALIAPEVVRFNPVMFMMKLSAYGYFILRKRYTPLFLILARQVHTTLQPLQMKSMQIKLVGRVYRCGVVWFWLC